MCKYSIASPPGYLFVARPAALRVKLKCARGKTKECQTRRVAEWSVSKLWQCSLGPRFHILSLHSVLLVVYSNRGTAELGGEKRVVQESWSTRWWRRATTTANHFSLFFWCTLYIYIELKCFTPIYAAIMGFGDNNTMSICCCGRKSPHIYFSSEGQYRIIGFAEISLKLRQTNTPGNRVCVVWCKEFIYAMASMAKSFAAIIYWFRQSSKSYVF